MFLGTAVRHVMAAGYVLVLSLAWPFCLLAQDGSDESNWYESPSPLVAVHGLVEMAGAHRLTNDAAQPRRVLMGEARVRLGLGHDAAWWGIRVKSDLFADGVTGGAHLDMREVVMMVQPTDAITLQAGRQILTWGTGDLVFLNDLFPKDHIAFLIGRDDEFLKAPATALRATIYTQPAALDIVWVPRFTPDRFPTGERLSFFDPDTGQRVGMEVLDEPIAALRPEKKWTNGELAARLYRTFGAYEMALYGYIGFSGQPTAFDSVRAQPTFSPLGAYGASMRWRMAGGISHIEAAYHDARRDRRGTDPMQPNSQIRLLLGHERYVTARLTLGLQYYLERIGKYDALMAHSPTPTLEPSQARHLVTNRWTYQTQRQRTKVSMFLFWSPTDGDMHLRPAVERKWNDAFKITFGANLFWGRMTTEYGQFAHNTHAYARMRYYF